MKIDKDMILEYLRGEDAETRADRAQEELPQVVDTEEHGGLLERLGLDVGELVTMAKSGAMGNIGDRMGSFFAE